VLVAEGYVCSLGLLVKGKEECEEEEEKKREEKRKDDSAFCSSI